MVANISEYDKTDELAVMSLLSKCIPLLDEFYLQGKLQQVKEQDKHSISKMMNSSTSPASTLQHELIVFNILDHVFELFNDTTDDDDFENNYLKIAIVALVRKLLKHVKQYNWWDKHMSNYISISCSAVRNFMFHPGISKLFQCFVNELLEFATIKHMNIDTLLKDSDLYSIYQNNEQEFIHRSFEQNEYMISILSKHIWPQFKPHAEVIMKTLIKDCLDNQDNIDNNPRFFILNQVMLNFGNESEQFLTEKMVSLVFNLISENFGDNLKQKRLKQKQKRMALFGDSYEKDEAFLNSNQKYTLIE